MTEPEKNYGFMWALAFGFMTVGAIVVCVWQIDDLIRIYGATARYEQSYKYMLLLTSLSQIFMFFPLAVIMAVCTIGAVVEKEEKAKGIPIAIIRYLLLFLFVTGLVGQVAISILSWYWGMS